MGGGGSDGFADAVVAAVGHQGVGALQQQRLREAVGEVDVGGGFDSVEPDARGRDDRGDVQPGEGGDDRAELRGGVGDAGGHAAVLGPVADQGQAGADGGEDQRPAGGEPSDPGRKLGRVDRGGLAVGQDRDRKIGE